MHLPRLPWSPAPRPTRVDASSAAAPSAVPGVPSTPPSAEVPATPLGPVAPLSRAPAPSGAVRAHTLRAAGPAQSPGAAAALQQITAVLDEAAAGMSPAELRARLVSKYTTLGLLDASGQWTVPELAPHAEALLPSTLEPGALRAFVAQMGEAASKNAYLMKFLDAASRTSFPGLERKLRTQGAEDLPDVLAHAQLLERLTHVLASDYRVSEACRAHWKTFESNPAFWKELNVFERVKLASVNLGIDKYNEIHRTGVVDPKTLDGVLPLNIMEAWTVDQYWAATGPEEARKGHADNAYAGWVLATHGPNELGPATLSPDGKMVELHPKATREWDDLYATWNMAFVFSVSGDLKYLTKLVIPEVNDYADKPGEYINKRALALHLTMINNAMEGLSGGREYRSWADPSVGALWGKVNAESAKAYAARAAEETQQRR